jgi:hypothetical protein
MDGVNNIEPKTFIIFAYSRKLSLLPLTLTTPLQNIMMTNPD